MRRCQFSDYISYFGLHPLKNSFLHLFCPMRHFGCLINVYLVKKLQTSHPPQLIMKGRFISFEDYIWSNGSHWISNSFNCHMKNSPQKCGPLLTEKSNLILSVVKGNFWLLQNCMQLNSQCFFASYTSP